LIDVHRELIVEPALGHLARGADDRVCQLGLEFAQVAVGDRGGDLDQARARMSALGSGCPEIGKLSTARWVCAP